MNDESLGSVVFILVIAVIWLGFTVHNQGETITQLKSIIYSCDNAVTNANQNIDDLNSQIYDAQYSAWSDYDTMGYALENLTTGEVVSNPCDVPSN